MADAVRTGLAVVALESTILAHGLPRGDTGRSRTGSRGRVRSAGAVPATVAVLDWTVRIGLTPSELDRLCGDDGIAKLSVRDVGVAVALGGTGATTVASTSALAHVAGIAVFAIGGLGGVHRGAAQSFDVSADLGALGRTPVLVVCAGVKSILDVPATLEYLETLSVPVIGYRTDAFRGFYLSDSGQGVPWRVETPDQAAAIVRARAALGTDRAGVVLANPVPPDRQLEPGLHDRTLADGPAGGRGRLRQGRHPATAGVLPLRHARREPAGQCGVGAGHAFLAGEVAAAGPTPGGGGCGSSMTAR